MVKNIREYNRGKRWAEKYYSKFRSFKKRLDGSYIGYLKNGSTEVIGHVSKSGSMDGGFYQGAYDVQIKIIKAKKTKVRTPRRKVRTGFHFDF